MLEELQSLIETINRNKIKQIEVIGAEHGSDHQVQELYRGIAEGRFRDEEEATDYFFSGRKNKKLYFNRLKRKLRDRLLNTAFFIDINQPNFTDLQRAYYTCYKNISLVKILIGRHNRKNAIPLAELTLKKAMRYEFTDIVLALAKELRLHYGIIIGDQKKFRYYHRIVSQYSDLLSAELKAEEYYSDMIIHFVNSRAIKTEIFEARREYGEKIKALRRRFSSFRLDFLTYLTLAIINEITNNYRETIKVCREAIAHFQTRKHLSSDSTVFNFYFKILASQVQLRQFREARQTAGKCLELLPAGSGNWYLTLHYSMIISYHLNELEEARRIFMQATSHPNFQVQYENISEHWRIHEAFMYYFLHTGKIKATGEDPGKKFRVSKFVNQVPIFSKDKRGTNIPILILQVLFLLEQGRYAEIIDRMESLKSYTHRYLRRDDTFRSNCFIKMLLCLPASSFHKAGVLRRSKPLWEKLQVTESMEVQQSAEIEIVPYELLWEYVMHSLGHQFR